MNFIEIQIIFLIVAIGFISFINTAWKERKDSFALKSFFLGGAKVGPTLTEHNTLGMTFAWSGGVWFFATLAFAYGPWVLILQIPWCLSIIFLAILFSRIHTATKNNTIHGYLHDVYGKKVRIIASIATSLGYIFNTGFELYWSALLLCNIVGYPEMALWVGLIFATITAIYCSIGGYKANASTDKPQNILGVLALTTLSVFVSIKTQSTILIIASIIFSVGSLIYVIFNYCFDDPLNAKKSKIVSILAIVLAILTIILTLWLSFQPINDVNIHLFKNTPFPLHLLIGIIIFQILFNVVDMANWQGIAANGDIEKSQHKEIKWALIRSALFLNWFPALGGVLLGLGMRIGYSGVSDMNIFNFAFSTVLPAQDIILRSIVVGFLILGFISTALSTADSYLMSATHTISYDIFYFKKVRSLLATEEIEIEEKKFVTKAKRFLLPLSLLMVFVFWAAYKSYSKVGGNALDFQMIMYSFAISLFPSVVYGLYKGISITQKLSNISFVSILLGIMSSIIPYLFVIFTNVDQNLRAIIVNLTPVYSITISSIYFIVGIYIKNTIKQ